MGLSRRRYLVAVVMCPPRELWKRERVWSRSDKYLLFPLCDLLEPWRTEEDGRYLPIDEVP